MRPLALWALALFVFSIPSENGVALPGVGSLSRLIGIGAFGVGLLSLHHAGRLRFRAPSLFLLVTIAFILWSAATFFWSIVPASTISRTFTLAQLAVLVWLIHQLGRTERDLAILRQAFVLGCYMVIGIAVALYASSSGFRDVGAFNPNGLAIVSALAIPMAWGLTIRPVFRFLTVVNALYPLFAMGAVVLAASRGGLITAAFALLIIPVTLHQLDVPRRVLLFAVVVGSLWAAFVFAPNLFPNLQQNIQRLEQVDEQLLEGTLTGRTVIWQAGFEVFRNNLLLGVGAAGFNQSIVEIHGSARSPHNAFLAVAVESGAIGLVLFAGLFVITFVGIIANPVGRMERLVLLLALVVAMLPTNSHNDKFAWFIVAMLATSRPIQVLVDGSARAAPVRPGIVAR